MSHSWILDVLADLDAYARKNELTAVAESLSGTRQAAARELAAGPDGPGLVCIEGGTPERAHAHDGHIGGAF